MMITENHNYEGTKIPYDNVWLGSRVIILGGEGAIIQAGRKYAIAAKVFSSRKWNKPTTIKEFISKRNIICLTLR